MRAKGRPERIRLDQLIVWPELQKRADGLDPDHAMGICRALKETKGKGLEKVKVRRIANPDDLPKELVEAFPDRRVWNLVTDGFHTTEGYRLANVRVPVPCDVLAGTYRDAFIDACGANAHHLAKNRTKEDREKAVCDLYDYLLESSGGKERWSFTRMAEVTRVDKNTVKEILKRTGRAGKDDTAEPEKTTGKDGRDRPSKGTPRRTKERSAAEPEVPVTMTGGWREMPLGEVINAPDYMWPKFEAQKLETCGQLYDKIRKGGLIGFMGGDKEDVQAQLEKMKNRQEVKEPKSRQGKPVYEWAKMEGYFGAVCRLVDEIPRVYPGEDGTAEFQAMHRNLDAFKEVYNAVKGKLTKSDAAAK